MTKQAAQQPTFRGSILDADPPAYGVNIAGRITLERGEASTIQDIAAAEKVTDRFVGRMMRLAYLAPDVLEKLLIHRIPPALSLNDLVAVAELPWAEQFDPVFGVS
jgi:hypothetical protein